ncbi:kelch repeat-containing protein [Dactylosporangium sp. NPDC005572]|uniref:Kelch repeat-containing protein n=1 Tax=Dactylosporangium sp. NPDC005572 TaxID=3156889 RepID=UPI0033B04414
MLLLGLSGCSHEPEPSPAPSDTPWQRLPDAPSARTEVAAAVSGTRIVVAGGYRADGGTVSTVEIFDTATGRWSVGPPLPLAVNHAMAAAVDGTIYVFGGYLGDGTPSAAAFRLGPTDQQWGSVADLPEGRAAGAAAAIGGTVHVAAGIGPGKDTLATTMLVYDTAAGRWRTAPGPPTPREHLGGAATGGKVYTVAGRTAKAGNLAVVEAYDPATGAWTRLPDLPTARGGLAATATCRGWVVAAGGEGQHTFNQVEAYDPAAGAWHALPPMPNPKHGLGLVTVGPLLYTLPGGPEPGLHVAATTEALDTGPCGG